VVVITVEDFSSIAAICSSPPIQEERGKSVGPRTAASLSSNGAPGPLNKSIPPTVGHRHPGHQSPRADLVVKEAAEATFDRWLVVDGRRGDFL
jgi:hypothetical protein